MKNSLFFILLSFIISFNTNAQYLIRLNIEECINCSSKISILRDHITIDNEIHILLPEKYKNDISFIDQRFRIDFVNKKYIFNDSIYYSLSEGLESMIYKISDNVVISQSKLKDLNESFFYNKIDDLCLEKSNSDHWLKQYGTIFISQSRPLGRITFYNGLSKLYKEFSADMSWTEMMYRAYYGEEKYREYFQVLKNIIEKQTHSVQSEILYALPDTDSTLYFLGSSTFFYEVDEKKVKAKKEHFIIEVNINNSDFLNVYHVDRSLLPDNYIINDFFFEKYKDLYYFQTISSDISKKNNLAEFYLKDDRLQFKRFTSSIRSKNYYEYRIFNNFLNPIISDGLYSEVFSDVFYDLYTEEVIKIPVKQIEFESLYPIQEFIINMDKMPKTYSVLDLKRNPETYEVLYKSYTGSYHVIIIDRKTNAETENIELKILNSENLKFAPSFCQTIGRNIKLFYEGEKCFEVIKY